MAELRVNIITPQANDIVGVNIFVQGNVAVLGGTIKKSNTNSVRVQFGGGGSVKATIDGGSWQCTGTVSSDAIGGRPLQISVDANVLYIPEGSPPSEPDSISGSGTVLVIPENTPPQLSINPPANVTQPFPPYIATLTGTASDTISGVASVGWRLSNGSSGTAQFNPSNSQWSATISLPNVGDNPVTVQATDRFTNSTSQTVNVKVIDNISPDLSITLPERNGETFILQNGIAIVNVAGTAEDRQTGVELVEWTLDNPQGAYKPAIPKEPGNWSTWTAPISISSPGGHTIYVRAKDKAGNLTPTFQQRSVDIAEVFEPKDTSDIFGPINYLDDLLKFAARRIVTPSGSLTIEQLTNTFHQPFGQLTKPELKPFTNHPVRQVRIAIEILRTLGKFTDEIAFNYRQTAYYRLLLNIGTSYAELRLARIADQNSRKTLADRLGIALIPTRPDGLDRLLLEPNQITDQKLADLFGLENITQNSGTPGVMAKPEFLTWQLDRLRLQWQQQDRDTYSQPNAKFPVIEPDLVLKQDLKEAIAGNPAFDLWTARQTWVNNKLTEIKHEREAETALLKGFDRIISKFIGAIDLAALAAKYQKGEAIEPALQANHLTLAALQYLVQIRKLATSGTVLDPEWTEVYSILLQVQKYLQFPTWREQEEQKNILLGPDLFKLPDFLALPSSVSLPKWRVTRQARQEWQNTLSARIQQAQAAPQALQTSVDKAEEASLPLLRDILIAAISPGTQPDITKTTDELSQKLLVDFKNSGNQKTTRINQAIETLQGVLFSVRTGRFPDGHEADNWGLSQADGYTEEKFDLEWQWMGSYTTWRSALFVFGYPENYLLPSLQEKHEPFQNPTKAFGDFVVSLRNNLRLTPTQARNEAKTYLGALGTSIPENLRPANFTITEQFSEAQLNVRRQLVQKSFTDLKITTLHLAPSYVKEIFYFVPIAIALQLQKSGQYLAALDWFQTVYAYSLPLKDNQRKIYYGLVLEAQIPNQFQRTPNWLLNGLNPHDIVTVRANAYSRFTILSLVRCFLDFADSEFTQDSIESVPRARSLYETAIDLLALPEMQPYSGQKAIFPPNPILQSLQLHAELNLFKIRSGRNIAGIERQTGTELAATSVSSLPAVDASGRLVPLQTASTRPSPYRYAVLIERAKLLVNIAQQIEAAFLSALEKRDAEAYNLLKAGHDLGIARATIQLQDLRVNEAEGNIGLANLQRQRSQIQGETYEEWIDTGLNQWEKDLLDNYKDAGEWRTWTAVADAALVTAQAIAGASENGILGTGAGAAWAGVGMIGVLAAARATTSILANQAETAAQINSTKASYERRNQEWQLQKNLSDQDVQIGTQQIFLAQSQRQVALQERTISGIQTENAEATVEFLANKFTNTELYEWMSGILERAYSYFLQQSTALAKLAQNQLTFERQELPPSYIQADYWLSPLDEATPPTNGQTTDRRGLTGSTRLLQDIYKLDQYAFDTKKRKLQLAQTFSLSQLFPLEFQRFRETGQLIFATPLEYFDLGFPGHYLRLIRRVRLSVVALLPPTRGIRATFTTSGISRVVVGGDVFHTIEVRRDPELIAFTSSSNATGLFELEPEGEFLLPFESMGVDTIWELQLPKAANPFDYRTLADVLLTIEYTALNSWDYRQQVIQSLDPNLSSDRSFSLRDQFADRWYDLHNPNQTGTPLTVKFKTLRDDFPPNLDNLSIQQVVMYFVRSQDATYQTVEVSKLSFTEDGSSDRAGGAATSIDDIISTRRGNASSWTPMIGKSPFGEWELSFPDNPQMRDLFAKEQIEDILLVITFKGHTSDWPS